jgi:hypothetical protein
MHSGNIHALPRRTKRIPSPICVGELGCRPHAQVLVHAASPGLHQLTQAPGPSVAVVHSGKSVAV